MGEDLVISDINGICRLCLKDDCTIIPIFGRENTSRNGIPLSKKILDCVSVKVFDGDGLPSMICVGCVHQVDSWHGFKNNCESSQKKLDSWLQKTKPDVYVKNEAERRREARLKAQHASDVIDLSSDDDDIVVTHQHQSVVRRNNNSRRLHNRPSNCLQNPEFMIRTNEIEISPVPNVCLNEKENHLDTEDIPSSDARDLPDVLTQITISTDDGNFVNDSSEDQVFPDADISDPLGNADPMASDSTSSENAAITKDSVPKDQLNNDDTDADNHIPEFEKSKEATSDANREQMQINESNLSNAVESNSLENDENCTVNENTSDSITNNHEPGDDNSTTMDHDAEDNPAHENQDSSNWTHPNEATVPGEIDMSNKNSSDNKTEENNPLTTDDNSTNCDRPAAEKNSTISENLDEENENSIGESSSLIIEKVTSLNNHEDERMDEESNSREVVEENIEKEASNGDWQSQDIVDDDDDDDDDDDVQPDIILCDSITSVVTHIKEEPLSANEGTEDEEDPLNFHSVMIKKEPEDYDDEIEDIKPNIRLLNEAIDNQYTPKRLKNGKVHCEPCRVSFGNDVYYERHTKSLRHRMNFKLFRSGKGPTKAKGKALIKVAMGNHISSPRGQGPYCCPQCPSRFKHFRNLHTHRKKHLLEVRVSSRKPSSDTASQSSDLDVPRLELTPKVRDDLKCDLCSQNFMSMPALVSHKRFCGVSERQYCNFCSQSFTTQSLFFKHRKECLKDFRRHTFTEQKVLEVKSSPTPPPPPSPSMSTPTSVTVPLDGTVLACTLCNLTFKTSPDLINHMQQNHMDFGKPQSYAPPEFPDFAKPNHFTRTRDSRLHYCKYCLRSFPTVGGLSSHTGYHARKNVYCCKFCRQTFRDKITFRQHMKVHIGDPSLNKNICWICYTPFATPRDLVNHKAVHANMKLKIFSCAICGNSYNSKELLSKHRRAAHMMPLANPEDEEMEIGTSNDTKFHQLIDEDNKLYKCRVCKKRFTTLGNLKRHSLKHKGGFTGHVGSVNVDHSFQHRCSWCFKSFKTQTGLLNHKPFCTRFRKTGIPNTNNVQGGVIKCKDCKRWFASQNSLYKHRVMKRCRPFQTNEEENIVPIRAQNCPNCDQQFLSEESLNRHKQNCKPSIERLTCDCGEVFSSVEQKLSHAETCAANCTCKTCNVKFNSPEELESHQSVCRLRSQTQTPTPPPPPQPQMPSFGSEPRLPSVECSKCKKKFVYSKCLQIHEDKCLYDRWPCSHCFEIFPSETALATHKSHRNCQSPRLNRSSSVTSLSDGPTFKCEHCPNRFLSANELKEHLLTCENRSAGIEPEEGLIDRPYKCDQCDKSFLWKANVLRHRKLAHKHLYSTTPETTPVRKNPEREASIYRCSLCPDVVFHKQQGLLEHQLSHERESQLSQEESERAENNTNEGGVLLTCELCDKKLPEALYPLHMDEHMNDDFEETQEVVEVPPVECELGEMFPCDICGKQFNSPQSRKSHRASHYRHYTLGQGSPFNSSFKKKIKGKHVRCNICNKLLSINSLPKHKMMHRREAAEFYGDGNQTTTPQKPPTQAVNPPSSYSPSLISELPSDQETNEDSSTSIFPCPKCDKSFKLRKLLVEHLRNHLDESYETESTSSATGTVDQYPYKCVYCDLSWKYKSVYERHMTSKRHLEIQKQLSGII